MGRNRVPSPAARMMPHLTHGEAAVSMDVEHPVVVDVTAGFMVGAPSIGDQPNTRRIETSSTRC